MEECTLHQPDPFEEEFEMYSDYGIFFPLRNLSPQAESLRMIRQSLIHKETSLGSGFTLEEYFHERDDAMSKVLLVTIVYAARDDIVFVAYENCFTPLFLENVKLTSNGGINNILLVKDVNGSVYDHVSWMSQLAEYDSEHTVNDRIIRLKAKPLFFQQIEREADRVKRTINIVAPTADNAKETLLGQQEYFENPLAYHLKRAVEALQKLEKEIKCAKCLNCGLIANKNLFIKEPQGPICLGCGARRPGPRRPETRKRRKTQTSLYAMME